MELKPFTWVLEKLAKSNILPVLDTYGIAEALTTRHYHVDSQGKSRATLHVESPLDLLSKVYREHQLLYRLGISTATACFFFLGEKRIPISETELAHYLKSEYIPPNLNLIQLPLSTNSGAGFSVHVQRSGIEYKCVVYARGIAGKKLLKNGNKTKNLSATANAIVQCINAKNKGVLLKATIEFVSDDQQSIWLSHVKHCLVNECPEFTEKTPGHKKKGSTKARLVNSLRRDQSESLSKLQASTRSRNSRRKKLKRGPVWSRNQAISSVTRVLLRLPKKA